MAKSQKNKPSYSKFSKIDGSHSFRKAVPEGYVDYETRFRKGGSVFYFNFDLAKEMGLIRKNHPHKLNRELTKAILDTFSIQIINEYDILNHTKIPEEEQRPGKAVMATRYLQLQHPSNKGYTSGDGRSIWNGAYENKGTTWDITSCGTGGTCLSPATAHEGKFYKTGDKTVSYGCGLSDLLDGVAESVMSEIFYHNDIKTTRILAVVSFSDNTSINVRVSKNLIRPAHFFHHLKQGNYDRLKGAADYYINRQMQNKEWPKIKEVKKRYEKLLEQVTIDFARAIATFESEYIFCWLDWDGDNILMDGAIIDYGSIRQFGLFHDQYRYDDVQRMSTTITEQKNKAKYIVQTFAQLTDFLITKKKKNLKQFKNHKTFKLFEGVYERTKEDFLLYKIGFDSDVREKILMDKRSLDLTREFQKRYSYFERVKARRGKYKISDGITWDAIFCMRDIMREMPRHYSKGLLIIPPKEFIEILKSNYASKKDLTLKQSRKEKILEFQELYWKLMKRASNLMDVPIEVMLANVTERSDVINRYARVTGDAIIFVSQKLMRSFKHLDSRAHHKMFASFVSEQVLRPNYFQTLVKPHEKPKGEHSKKHLDSMFKIVEECREGI